MQEDRAHALCRQCELVARLRDRVRYAMAAGSRLRLHAHVDSQTLAGVTQLDMSMMPEGYKTADKAKARRHQEQYRPWGRRTAGSPLTLCTQQAATWSQRRRMRADRMFINAGNRLWRSALTTPRCKRPSWTASPRKGSRRTGRDQGGHGEPTRGAFTKLHGPGGLSYVFRRAAPPTWASIIGDVGEAMSVCRPAPEWVLRRRTICIPTGDFMADSQGVARKAGALRPIALMNILATTIARHVDKFLSMAAAQGS